MSDSKDLAATVVELNRALSVATQLLQSSGQAAAAAAPASGPASVSAVAVKIPRLHRANPASWFVAAEVQFGLAGVTRQSTKLFHMLAALDPADSHAFRDVVAAAQERAVDPHIDVYDEFKTAVLEASQKSYFQACQEFKAYRIGDQRPRVALLNLLDLWPDGKQAGKDSLAFKGFFVEKLPADVQKAVLQRGRAVALDEIVEIANGYLEQAQAAGSVCALGYVSSSDSAKEALVCAAVQPPAGDAFKRKMFL